MPKFYGKDSQNQDSDKKLTQSIKQQYFNADSVGIKPHTTPTLSSHQPIPIQRIFEAITRHVKKNRGLSPSAASSSSQQHPQIQLDGFFILEKTRLDFPDHIARADLSSMRITSALPEDLTYFSSLQYLDVSDNSLSISPFSVLPNLQELRIACNGISEISPEDVEDGFNRLNILDLSYNHLTSDSIQNLCHLKPLQLLDLSGNGIVSIPQEMFLFQNLDTLTMTHNKLVDDKIFVTLSYMPKVRILNLSYNYLSNIIKTSCDSSDQFKCLERLDVSFNYFTKEDALLPILDIKKIYEVVIYGNPVLGPTGDDPQQMYVENLVDAATMPGRFGRKHAVQIITDIPRDRMPAKGEPLARHARYRNFKITKVDKENIKSNKEWREEGNKSLFAEAMSLLERETEDPGSVLTLNDDGDAFFLTEVDAKSASSAARGQQAATKAMDTIAADAGMNDTIDIDELEKHVQLHAVMVPQLAQEIEEKELERENDPMSVLKHITDPSPQKDLSLMINDQPKKVIKSNVGYSLPLKTALHALKFAVDHPLTNYNEVPAKGFLPPWSYVQHNEAYKNRKVQKYESLNEYPPMIVSVNTSRTGTGKTNYLTTHQKKAGGLRTAGKSSFLNYDKGRGGRANPDAIPDVVYDQIEEVLSDLNRNTSEIASKPPGQGHNLQENIDALKRFAKPHSALQGLATLVSHALDEFEK